MNKGEKERLSRVFKAIDLSGEGKLDRDELYNSYHQFFENSDVTRDEIDKIFKMVDFDKNGTIEYSEFIVAALHEDEIFTDVKI